MSHPYILLKLSHLRHQERLCEIETWRLERAAHQHRAGYISQLSQRLVAAAWQHLPFQARLKRVKSDLANLPAKFNKF